MKITYAETQLIKLFLKLLKRERLMHIAKAKSGIYRNIHNGKLSPAARKLVDDICERNRMYKHMNECAEK